MDLQCQSIVTTFAVFQQGCGWIRAAAERGSLHASPGEKFEESVLSGLLSRSRDVCVGVVDTIVFYSRCYI